MKLRFGNLAFKLVHEILVSWDLIFFLAGGSASAREDFETRRGLQPTIPQHIFLFYSESFFTQTNVCFDRAINSNLIIIPEKVAASNCG